MESINIQDQINLANQQAIVTTIAVIDEIFIQSENVAENTKKWFSGMPVEFQNLYEDYMENSRKGIDEFKKFIKRFGKIDFSVKDPRDLLQHSLSIWEENINRSLKTIESIQSQGRELVEKVTEKLPIQGKEITAHAKKATEKSMNAYKKSISNSFDMASKMIQGEFSGFSPLQ